MDTARFSILAICLFAVVNQAFAEVCAGCVTEVKVDEKYAKNLNSALSSLNEPYDVVKINKVTTQVVNGIAYRMNFDNRTPQGTIENCDAYWVERIWQSTAPQSLKVTCGGQSVTKTGARTSRKALLGASKDVDSSEMGYIRELANAAAEKLDEVDVDNNKRVVTDIVEAKKQIVSGILYHIQFLVKTTSCDENSSSKSVDNCENTEVEPRKLCKVSMHRSFSEDNPLSAKMVNSRCTDDTSSVTQKKAGSPNDVKVDDEYIKKMAKFAAENINMKTNGLFLKKVTKIVESNVQVVSGKMVKLVIELQETDCTKQNDVDLDKCNVTSPNGFKTVCNVAIWDQPWLNSKKVISEGCQTRQKRSAAPLLGGSSPVDVQDKSIVGLQDFIATELTSRANSDYTKTIVKVFNATTQVVSGSLTRMTVEVADTNCLKSENKARTECQPNAQSHQICHVTIWEQAWLNKKEITQSECHAIQPEKDVTDSKINEISENAGINPRTKHIREFVEFTERHNRTYKDVDEFLYRFRIFRANMARISYLQKTEQGTGIYGPNMFADMTRKEFMRFLGLKRGVNEGYPYKTVAIPNITIPDEFDWRNSNAVTSVKNQGACGSCWAFSVAGNIEGQNAIKNKKLVSLSEQELVDCDKYDQGCNGGDFDTAYRAVEDLGGLETETDYPYKGRKEACHMIASEPKIAIHGALNVSQNEKEIAKYLVAHGPLSVGINANAMQFYMGGVSHPLKFLCSPNSLDHGVLLVGYGTHRTRFTKKLLPYWLIKNSWGTGWGEKGYYMVYRGDGTCGVNRMVTSSIL